MFHPTLRMLNNWSLRCETRQRESPFTHSYHLVMKREFCDECSWQHSNWKRWIQVWADGKNNALTVTPHHSHLMPARTSEELQVRRQTSQRAPEDTLPSRQICWYVSYTAWSDALGQTMSGYVFILRSCSFKCLLWYSQCLDLHLGGRTCSRWCWTERSRCERAAHTL